MIHSLWTPRFLFGDGTINKNSVVRENRGMILQLVILSFRILADSGSEFGSGLTVELEEKFSGREETTSAPYQYSSTAYQYYDDYEYAFGEHDYERILRVARNDRQGKKA